VMIPTPLDWTCAKAALEAGFVPAKGTALIEEMIRLQGVFGRRGEVLNLAGFLDFCDFTGNLAPLYFKPLDDDVQLAHLEGLVTIADYKSRSSFSYAPMTEQLIHDPQLAKYAAMGVIGSLRSPWRGLEPGTPSASGRPFPTEVVVCHVNIGTKVIEVDRRWAVMPWKNVEAAWVEAEAEAMDLLDLCHIDRLEDVTPTKSACGKYGGCDFRDICPHSPLNRSSRGTLASLFRSTNNAPSALKEKKKMLNFREKFGKKAEPKNPPPVAHTEEEALASLKSTGSIALPARPKTAVQAADAGPQTVVTPPLIVDTIRVAQKTATDNGLTLDLEVVEFAATNVGLDLTQPAAIEGLQEALDAKGIKVKVPRPAQMAPQHASDEAPQHASDEAAVAAAVPAPATVGGSGLDAAMAAIRKAVGAGGGSADRKATCVLARKANNAAVEAGAEGEKIGRFSARRLGDMIDAVDDLTFDAGTDTIAAFGFARTPEAIDTTEANATTEAIDTTEADVALEAELAELRAKRDAEAYDPRPKLDADALGGEAEEVAEAYDAEAEAAKDKVLHDLARAEAKAYEDRVANPPSAAAPSTGWPFVRLVLVNSVPMSPIGNALDFADWLKPFIAEVEAGQGGIFWNAADYAKGPGMVANVVARALSKDGIEALPLVLVVDKFHPAWQSVRDLLGRLDGVAFIGATR
jgi:hypothetical protein